MALSVSHQVMLSVSLVLCICVLMPRMFGGGGRADLRNKPVPQRMSPASARIHRESHSKEQMGGTAKKTYPSSHQMRNVMEQELNKDKSSGSGRSIAFTLMPLYAIGVAVFAAYKFAKLKSKDNSSSQIEKEAADQKTKETETHLVELERHLSQTEQMLNSLLTQLDPLSNCVNTLANEQRGDLMKQLQSIRRLMKESGMDKSAPNHPVRQTCNDTLDDLIDSFKQQESEIFEQEEDCEKTCEEQLIDFEETDILQGDDFTEDVDLLISLTSKEAALVDDDLTSQNDGVRQRNIKN